MLLMVKEVHVALVGHHHFPKLQIIIRSISAQNGIER